jgi:hypothetical protein
VVRRVGGVDELNCWKVTVHHQPFLWRPMANWQWRQEKRDSTTTRSSYNVLVEDDN